MKYQLARRSCSIDRTITDRTKAKLLVAKLIDQCHEVANGAAKPIEPPNEKHISRTELLEAGIQSRALMFRARRLVRKDQILAHSRTQQGVNLKREVLVLRANASVPDKPRVIRDRDHRSPKMLRIEM